jgi:hypothetical protein
LASVATAVTRARADYMEMPGLQLTAAQAARLWSVDLDLCRRALAVLVKSRFLKHTRNVFIRAA